MTKDAAWLLEHFLEDRRKAHAERFKVLLEATEVEVDHLEYDSRLDPISPDFDIRSWV